MNLKRIIREEINNDLQWIKEVTPSLSEMWGSGLIKKGDVLILSGYLLGNDHTYGDTGIYVDDFKIEVTHVADTTMWGYNGVSSSSYFIPLQEKYWEYLGYSKTRNPNREDLSFSRQDGDMLVVKHIPNKVNK